MQHKHDEDMDVGKVWWFWWTTSAFHVDKQLRGLNRLLPSDPRCKFCAAPFRGLGGTFERVVFRKQQSSVNPRFCNMCEEAMRRFPGGAEVPMSMLFADIRGSTELSARMKPSEFGRVINRFYTTASKLISDEDGLVEKLAGDAVAAFWGPGFAGARYVGRTVDVAKRLSIRMRQQDIPVGIGVHVGTAFFGAVGTAEGLTNLTAAGEEVNLAARLAQSAAAGEVVISTPALAAANIDGAGLERRTLDLKGIAGPVAVHILQAS